MGDTKQKILLTALRLFAKDGYEAVSVSTIAAELGMTKGALYKHYKNKRDIFDSIIDCMRCRDAERAKEYDVPVGTIDEMPAEYCAASIGNIVEYAKGQFRYWTQDEFARCFRRMLALEQFRSEEMSLLYQQYLVFGPLGYMTDLFESMQIENAAESATKFYGVMFLMYSVYDGADDKAAVTARLDACLDGFSEKLKGSLS